MSFASCLHHSTVFEGMVTRRRPARAGYVAGSATAARDDTRSAPV